MGAVFRTSRQFLSEPQVIFHVGFFCNSEVKKSSLYKSLSLWQAGEGQREISLHIDFIV